MIPLKPKPGGTGLLCRDNWKRKQGYDDYKLQNGGSLWWGRRKGNHGRAQRVRTDFKNTGNILVLKIAISLNCPSTYIFLVHVFHLKELLTPAALAFPLPVILPFRAPPLSITILQRHWSLPRESLPVWPKSWGLCWLRSFLNSLLALLLSLLNFFLPGLLTLPATLSTQMPTGDERTPTFTASASPGWLLMANVHSQHWLSSRVQPDFVTWSPARPETQHAQSLAVITLLFKFRLLPILSPVTHAVLARTPLPLCLVRRY